MSIFSRIASLFGVQQQATGNPADDRYFMPFPSSTSSGIRVTFDTALKCGAVWRCVSILSDTLSTMPLNIYQLKVDGVTDGGMDPTPDHPVNDIIALRPNPRDTAAQFWSYMLFHAIMHGESRAEIIPGRRGFADRLEPIHPNDFVGDPEMLPDGTLRFRVRNQKTGQTRTLLQEELLRIPGLSSDGVTGLRTIDFAAEAIALSLAAEQNAARVFSNALNVGGVFSHPQRLSKEGRDRLKADLMQRFAGPANAHNTMILQEGMKYEKVGQTAVESQLLDARKWQIGEISRYFGGVPLHLLGIDDQTNRATAEEQGLNFVRYTIRPWAEKIEQSIGRDLILLPRRYVAAFNLDELERGGAGIRATYNSASLGAGGSPPWLTQNEVRAREGYNKIDDPAADKLAQGTNPTQQQQKPIVPAAEVAPVTPEPNSGAGGAEAVIEPIPELEVEQPTTLVGESLVRKETTALRKFAMRHADDNATFRKAVNAFYGGFAFDVSKRLGVTKDQAKEWCKRRANRIAGANDIAAAIDALEQELDEAVAHDSAGEH